MPETNALPNSSTVPPANKIFLRRNISERKASASEVCTNFNMMASLDAPPAVSIFTSHTPSMRCKTPAC